MTSGSVRARVWLLCAAALVGVYLCSSGLLRLNEVFTHSSSSSKSDGARRAAPEKQYDRLVVVLIDALRADMVLGSDVMYGRESAEAVAVANDATIPVRNDELNAHMPYTRGLVAAGDALGYIGHASVPTVTMPRLKALVTGKAPAFIDILKNFNSAALAEENLVSLLAESGQRIVFYGDDTWLKLFPTGFQRSDGTSGFFTRDTVEVDTNVTRHLQDELDPKLQSAKSVDWDVLVLHYLGLDHVGHLRGPRSAMMVDKLHEMDAIVERVHESVMAQDALRKQQNPSAKPSLILLCSDHGMSEVGNHGGATVEESSALMLFLRGDGRKMRRRGYTQRRKQVDLVPTVASLFGLHIPPYSTGLLLDEVVLASSSSGHHHEDMKMSERSYLQALYRNLQQLYKLAVIKFHASSLVEFDTKYGVAIEELRVTLEQAPVGGEDDGDAELTQGVLVREACGVLQDKLAESDGSEYNSGMVLVGLCFLFASASVALRMLLQVISTTSRISSKHQNGEWQKDPITLVLIGGSALQVISLTSSSSIENEHATAFYLLTTVLFAFGLKMVSDSTLRHQVSNRVNALLVAVLLLSTRMLRSRNQVINFGRLNDIPVDLQTPGSEFAADDSLSILSTGPLFSGAIPTEACFVLICGLVSWKALRLCTKKSVSQHPVALLGLSLSSLSFTLGMFCSLLCCRMARLESELQEPSTLSLLVLAEQFSADDYARAVYAIVALVVVLLAVNRLARLLVAEMAVWLLVTLLQRESNLPTLACLCVQLFCLSSLLSAGSPSPNSQQQQAVPLMKSGVALGLLALWLAQSAFFALGNSHLVTTIDLSQSFHGLSGYTQWLVGLLTAVSVFSGPLAVFVNLLQWVQSVAMSPAPSAPSTELFEKEGGNGSASISGGATKKEDSSTATDVCLALFVYQILRFAVYTIVVYLMRFHLFIWSVFAPKMLYEVAQTGVVLALVLVVSMLSQDANNSSTTRHTKRS
ncbi:hypothetical protein Gpo141_00001087 [Globisporangium polare]